MSDGCGDMFIPLGAVFDHLVEDGQELADTGDEGDFEGFAGGDEAVVEGTDFVVGTGGGQGGHIERVAQGGAVRPGGRRRWCRRCRGRCGGVGPGRPSGRRSR